MKRAAQPGLAAAYDAGFLDGVAAGADFTRLAKRKLTWCWWVVIIETVLLAAFVARLGVAWLEPGNANF